MHPTDLISDFSPECLTHYARFPIQFWLAQLKIETQNNNVAANRFYQAMGCRLGVIHRFAYAGIAGVEDEVMLLWYLAL